MADPGQTHTPTSMRTRLHLRPRPNGHSSSSRLHRILPSQFPDDQSVYDQLGEGLYVGAHAATLYKAETKRQGAEVTPRLDSVHSSPSEGDGLGKSRDGTLDGEGEVTWDGPDDPKNPKNWSMRRKWAATVIVSAFAFMAPASASMISPALNSIKKDFNIKEHVLASLTLSIFVLAYAFGPLLFGPLSEIYGRVRVLQLANLFFLAWNLGCGFAQNSGQLMAFRFMSGLGGSAPLSIGGGVLSDCFGAEQRGRAVSIYSFGPLLGPAIGPIAGGYIAEYTTWRWCFWSTSIFTVVVQCLGFFFLQETYAPKLLAWKRDKLRKETGNMNLHTEYDSPDRTLLTALRFAMKRPFILLATQPIVQVLACYMAYLHGLMFLMLATFPKLWKTVYAERVSIGSLNFISMGLGYLIGTQICAPLNDAIYRRLKKKNNNIGVPEFRVPIMIPASLLAPVGLFWYGWSAQAHLHWIMPNIGATIFCAGTIVGIQCIQIYLVDSYTVYAASAIAAATVLRSLAQFGFPLFAEAMFDALHYGWGNSLLGFVAMGLGVPAPFLLWKFGARLRGKSQFAAG
ncbi:MFS general substrate transporter [Byssothecium circinans]|uniref:MFS general substrate transporter n=1 Tax=Byssothecium circinans TaxID=147558 RepID=A0A6A5TL51_9PLEO|nr:MFS general substrate transporter [Byssothecium circinans]